METSGKETQKMSLALITGGSRGLGKSMAQRLAAKGVDMIVTYNSQKGEAEALVNAIMAEGGKAAALQLDITRPDTFSDFATQLKTTLKDAFGRTDFDYLVNNAGAGVNVNIADATMTQFDLMMNMHLKGPFFLTQILLPLMKDGGKIVNITTGLTRFSAAGFAPYAMMKGGLEVFTRYLAQELGPRGITVNSLAPGAIETDFGGGMVRDNAEMNKMLASHTALGRVGLPDDIGGAVASLLTGETGWINGQRIEASGGYNL
jgi:NAD(P)-dependent dehydrogenase (short-subunit alcohol dehydrogenase family)